MFVAALQAHDCSEQSEKEPGEAGGAREQDQTADQHRDEREEFQLVGEQQWQQELAEFFLHLELAALLASSRV